MTPQRLLVELDPMIYEDFSYMAKKLGRTKRSIVEECLRDWVLHQEFAGYSYFEVNKLIRKKHAGKRN